MRIYYKVHRDGWRGVLFAVDVPGNGPFGESDLEGIARACARDFGLPEDWKTPAVFTLHAKEGGPELARFTITATRPETVYSVERAS